MSSALLVPRAALAGDRQDIPDPPQPVPPGTPGTTTVVAPPGSGGVTVVAPGPNGGSVTASGCTTVVVQGQPTMVGPGGAPCPTLAPYQPYQPYPPQYAYGPAPMYAQPRYARDPDRTAALIGSSIGFGVGAGVAGLVYLIAWTDEQDHCNKTHSVYTGSGTYETQADNSKCGSSRASLVTYGAIMTFIPSVPRFVVGDTTKGLIYTGLRGAAISVAALVNWGDNSDTKWQGPFLLGFAAPLTLAIIDLATTPHREDLEDSKPTVKAGVKSLSPVAVGDGNGHVSGGMLAMGGLF
ncbi:MAG: hypothetical protein ACXWUG_00180 [Polyangiales bacterium]